MEKKPQTKDVIQDVNPAEETELIDQFIKKMKLRNRILKKLTENLQDQGSQSVKKPGH